MYIHYKGEHGQRPQLNHINDRVAYPQGTHRGRKVGHSPISGTALHPEDARPTDRGTNRELRDTLPFSVQGTVPNKHAFDPFTYSEPKYSEFNTKIDNHNNNVTVDPNSVWRANDYPHNLSARN